MSNIPYVRTLDLLASSYHFIDRRCRYHATDVFERRVIFERTSWQPQQERTPSMLKGLECVDSSVLKDIPVRAQSSALANTTVFGASGSGDHIVGDPVDFPQRRTNSLHRRSDVHQSRSESLRGAKAPIEVKARLCSVLVPASIVYALNRWKKVFGRMVETA